MPIKVACQCGQQFAAPDKLAGKTVKCPKCGSPLKIPAPGAAAPARAAAPAAAAKPAALSGLLDEAGLKAAPGGTHCPGCHQPMPANAVLCVQCGYNLKTGKRLETMVTTEAVGPGGVNSESMLERAARLLEEEKQQKRLLEDAGTPWWVWLLLLLLLCSFIAAALILKLEPLGVLIAFSILVGAFMLFGGFLIAACSIYDNFAQRFAKDYVGVPVPGFGRAATILIVNNACSLLPSGLGGAVARAIGENAGENAGAAALIIIGLVMLPINLAIFSLVLKAMLPTTFLRGLAVSLIFNLLVLAVYVIFLLVLVFAFGVAIGLSGAAAS